ncbi:substrate-binding periplasmic protein [Pseudomonas sp. LRF_L74]|uniref:substrate-binding periplasmic protein n=1 Tax=Pseudomonas sp. LRF_L74 TaxID=3369422 RepID=UPI003F6317B7
MERLLAPIGMVLVLAMGSAGADEPLNIYVGQGQMPHADANRGIFGEVMQVMCARLQRDCHYISVPWRRVQLEAARDPNGIVLNLGRINEREDDFVWLLDVVPTSYVLVSRGERYDSLSEALHAGPVVVMGGTPRAQELQLLKAADQVVVEVNEPEQAARMLESGRVKSWYEIDLRVHYLWRLLGYSGQSISMGRPVSVTRSYIAGSPVLVGASEMRREMAQAFGSMISDGRWHRILARYLGNEVADALQP